MYHQSSSSSSPFLLLARHHKWSTMVATIALLICCNRSLSTWPLANSHPHQLGVTVRTAPFDALVNDHSQECRAACDMHSTFMLMSGSLGSAVLCAHAPMHFTSWHFPFHREYNWCLKVEKWFFFVGSRTARRTLSIHAEAVRRVSALKKKSFIIQREQSIRCRQIAKILNPSLS